MGERSANIWKIFFTTLVAPDNGWRDLEEKGLKPDNFIVRFFIPLCLLGGCADFISLLYDSSLSFSETLVSSVINFIVNFLSYFLAIVVAGVFLPHHDKKFPYTPYGRFLVMFGVGSLVVYHILFRFLPMFDFLIEFFPLWTVYLIYKGCKKVDFDPSKSTYALGVMCVTIICCPILLEWVFSFIQA